MLFLFRVLFQFWLFKNLKNGCNTFDFHSHGFVFPICYNFLTSLNVTLLLCTYRAYYHHRAGRPSFQASDSGASRSRRKIFRAGDHGYLAVHLCDVECGLCSGCGAKTVVCRGRWTLFVCLLLRLGKCLFLFHCFSLFNFVFVVEQ